MIRKRGEGLSKMLQERGFVTRWRLRRRAASARQYLRSTPDGEDRMGLYRRRAESAQDLMQDQVFNETFQMLNEAVVSEIAAGALLADEERRVLFLKLQLISEFQHALMAHVNEYETLATVKEAERRQDEQMRFENG